MTGRTLTALVVGAMMIACAAGVLEPRPTGPAFAIEPIDGDASVIVGIVRDEPPLLTPIEGALVILKCSCLETPQETTTNADGIFGFGGLPAGAYTVQVLYNTINVTREVVLPAGTRATVHWGVRTREYMLT